MVQMEPSSLGEFIKAAKFLKLNGFDGVNSNIDVDNLLTATQQTTNRKRSFSLKLKRVDAPQASVQQANDTINVTLDGNIDNVTSTMHVDDGKFFPSSDSDGSDGKN